MKKQNFFVKSKYPRRENDFYPTIDSRCVKALIETLPDIHNVCDPCAPNGSGIIDSLVEFGFYQPKGVADAYAKKLPKGTRWVVSNPPYKIGVVDKIINAQIERIESGEIIGVAMLLRTGFDHAKKYKYLFKDSKYYAGQIKLTFRPFWIEGSKGSPIHNYVWHIWENDLRYLITWVRYW